MKIDWIDLKQSLNYGFLTLPCFGFIGAISEHDQFLRYGSIIEVIIYTVCYILVRIKAKNQSKQVYDSSGKLLDKRQSKPGVNHE